MKKILSVAMASVLAVGMSTVAFAANAKITGFKGTLADENNLTVKAGKVIEKPLVGADFNWGEGDQPRFINASMVRTNKLTVRSSVRSGSKVIKAVSLAQENHTVTEEVNNQDTDFTGKTATIKIEFVDPFVSVDDVDFDLTVNLYIDGGQPKASFNINGTMINDPISVYEGDNTVDLHGGMVAVAQDYVRKIEADLGNDVVITTNMFKNKKYYGIATIGVEKEDEAVFAKYPNLEMAYTLKTVGFSSTADTVKINTANDKYFVYNADMKLLGNTAEALPFATKYYLSTEKIEIADEEVEEDDEVAPGEDTSNPTTGGDTPVVIENVNNNPSTGR